MQNLEKWFSDRFVITEKLYIDIKQSFKKKKKLVSNPNN